MIYTDSRYNTAVVANVGDARRGRQLTVFPQAPGVQYRNHRFEFRWHVVVDGERYEILSYHAYGTPSLWWLIALANPEYPAPDEAPPGAQIRIPDVDTLR